MEVLFQPSNAGKNFVHGILINGARAICRSVCMLMQIMGLLD